MTDLEKMARETAEKTRDCIAEHHETINWVCEHMVGEIRDLARRVAAEARREGIEEAAHMVALQHNNGMLSRATAASLADRIRALLPEAGVCEHMVGEIRDLARRVAAEARREAIEEAARLVEAACWCEGVFKRSVPPGFPHCEPSCSMTDVLAGEIRALLPEAGGGGG